jgi:ADP-ribose pyrophosphatase YjhB (NUDIX family)
MVSKRRMLPRKQPSGAYVAAYNAANAAARTGAVASARAWGARSTTATGAPPPRFPGSAQLFLVVPSLPMPGGSDLGPSVLLMQEYRPKDPKVHQTWGPPGGQTDKTDHSPLHGALREFKEEVGAPIEILKLANLTGKLHFTRLKPRPGANEAWMLFIDADANTVEAALFGQDRSSWNLSKRMRTPLSNEVVGYAFVPLANVLKLDRAGNVRIGRHIAKLRTPGHTLAEAMAIQRELGNLVR